MPWRRVEKTRAAAEGKTSPAPRTVAIIGTLAKLPWKFHDFFFSLVFFTGKQKTNIVALISPSFFFALPNTWLIYVEFPIFRILLVYNSYAYSILSDSINKIYIYIYKYLEFYVHVYFHVISIDGKVVA